MKLKFYIYTFFAFLLTVIILSFPSACLSFSLNGLNLWFQRMIPTLFPFMVLSGIMIRMNLTSSFVKVLKPLMGRIFQLSDPCIYGIVIGFLCGFPMGAHVTAQLYTHRDGSVFICYVWTSIFLWNFSTLYHLQTKHYLETQNSCF